MSYWHIMRELTYSMAAATNRYQELICVPVVLIALLTIQILRTSIFGRFEVETPFWKRLIKWIGMYGVTIIVALFCDLGYWPLVLPVGWTVLDLVRHLAFCHREGIHPIRGTPRRKLYRLKGWEWLE